MSEQESKKEKEFIIGNNVNELDELPGETFRVLNESFDPTNEVQVSDKKINKKN